MHGGAALALVDRRAAGLPVSLKHTLPWHPTALMSFPGIGSGAVEGLLNWSSETLPSEMMCSGSRRCELLPAPRGPALQHAVVIRRPISLSPCTAPGLARTISQTKVTRLLDFLGELTQVDAGEQNDLGGMRKNRRAGEGGKKTLLFVVGADRCFIFHGAHRTRAYVQFQKRCPSTCFET